MKKPISEKPRIRRRYPTKGITKLISEKLIHKWKSGGAHKSALERYLGKTEEFESGSNKLVLARVGDYTPRGLEQGCGRGWEAASRSLS